MDAAKLLELILPAWRAKVAPVVGADWFDQFVDQKRSEIVAELAPLVAVVDGSRRARASEQAPPDEWTPARRTKANLEAMEILAAEKEPDELTPAERRALRRYSGWGGLSIEKNRDQFPEGWDPETFGLIHEYYTPSKVAQAIGELVCPLLDGIKGKDGRILALEPSAGIGRLIHGVERARCPNKPPIDWITVEFSKVSSAILPRLWPQHVHHAGSFEAWIDRNSTEHAGQWKPDFYHQVQLVVSNPPYGERGLSRRQDRVSEYKAERMAYAYFMRRCLDLLVPRGVGVFLVPAGFLTGRTDSQQSLREKILRRHHLSAAYRLPSQLFPGAQLVTDLLVWRARGGALAEVDGDDEFIARGEYFDEFPAHILGKEEGRDYGRDDQLTQRKQGRSWYRVVGKFEALPEFWERGICTACRIKPIEFPSAASQAPTSAVRKLEVSDDGHTPALEAALYLGVRIGAFLKALAADAENAPLLWRDLYTTLLEFWDSKLRKDEAPDNPYRWIELVKLSDSGNGPAQLFLNAWTTTGDLVAAIRNEPVIRPRWSGAPEDVAGQAQHLYLARRFLTLEDLAQFHHEVGGPHGRDELLEVLLAADWNLDPTSEPETRVDADEALALLQGRKKVKPKSSTYLTPLADYITGVLWPKYDHARAQAGDQWRKQAERLRKAIDEVEFDDIESFSQQDGWVPVSLVSEWAQETISPTTIIDRDKGLYTIKGLDYSKPESFEKLIPESLWLLGWLNHEGSLFKPTVSETAEETKARRKRKEKLPSAAVLRQQKAEEWKTSFRAWIREDDERQLRLTDAYNRAFRGYTFPSYSQEPLEIARWSDAIKLYPHQVAGARRLLANRGGMLSFDTGVGKTYTLLAVIARARQEGWARRPVLITPVSLLWKWRNDFERALPDFRVAVIGSELHQREKGDIFDEATRLFEEGAITKEQYKARITVSRPDSKRKQADKWLAFIAGAYDAVILSVQAMSSIKVDENSVIEYAESLAAVQRSIAITARNARKEDEKNEADKEQGKKVKEISERRRAIMQHKTAGWVADKLEGQKVEEDFVPGLTWSDLNVDLLLVDEAAMFKNLWGVVKAWGETPKWIGNASPSQRAWQFDFRAAEVRRRNGGTGVALATATPFPNGVGDAFSMMKYIDAQCWERMGIDDPYQFVDQFVRIEDREYIDESTFNLKTGPAVVGFNNLEKLRTVILRYGEFRTAKDVGLDRIMPEPRAQQIFVDLDETQEEKYSYEIGRLEKLLKVPQSTEEEDEIAQIRSELLAIQAKLTLVALHGHADEGYTWELARAGGVRTKKVQRGQLDRFLADGWELAIPLKDRDTEATVKKDLPKPLPESPKGLKCAELILAQRNCGHIVFCQNLAPQVWLVDVLVEAGIPRDRIGILNAKVAASDRPKIATAFTGDPDKGEAPSLDVVIANSVAYEGLDLQLRTCAIHHLDLPWTPGDLEQRNGRAYRQKNACPILNIYYYLSRGSTDGVRLTNVQGKSGWMEDLLDLSKNAVNNPAAESELTAEDLLIELSRDKEAVRRLIAEKKERQRDSAYAKVRQLAIQLMTAVDGRYQRIRAGVSPDKSEQLREDAEGALSQLLLTDAKAWPWVEWARTVRDRRWLLPLKQDGVPVFENLRIVRRNRVDVDRIEAFEFGIVYGTEIGLRAAGAAAWRRVDTAEVQRLGISPEDMPGRTPHDWPEDDAVRTREAIERELGRSLRVDATWGELGWRGATDAWTERWWPVFRSRIIDGLSKSVRGERIPVVRDGVLEFRSGPTLRDVEVLPPTRAGWHRFLQLAPASGAAYKTLQEAGELWWWRDVPYGLLNKDAARAATVYTPGTRISWRGVGDWLAGLETIQAREDAKRRDEATIAHLDALANAPDVIQAADDLQLLEAKVAEFAAVEKYKEAATRLSNAIEVAKRGADTGEENSTDETIPPDVQAEPAMVADDRVAEDEESTSPDAQAETAKVAEERIAEETEPSDGFLTPGVRQRWRDLGEWLDVMVEIEGRRDATSRTGKVRAHVQALADNLDPVLAISTDEQVMRVWRAWGGGERGVKPDRWTGRGDLRALVMDALDRRCAKRNKASRGHAEAERPRVRQVLESPLIDAYTAWFDENRYAFTASVLRDLAKSASNRLDVIMALIRRLHTTFAWTLLDWPEQHDRKTRRKASYKPEIITVPDEAVMWRDGKAYMLVTMDGDEFPVPASWIELQLLEGEPWDESLEFGAGREGFSKTLRLNVPVYKYAIRDATRAKTLLDRKPYIALFRPFGELGRLGLSTMTTRDIEDSFREPEEIETALAIVAELDGLMMNDGPIRSAIVSVAPVPHANTRVERAVELLSYSVDKVERLTSGSPLRVRLWVGKDDFADVCLFASGVAAAWDWTNWSQPREVRAWLYTAVDAALHGRRAEVGALAEKPRRAEFKPARVIAQINDDPDLAALASILYTRLREESMISPSDAVAMLRSSKVIDLSDLADHLENYVIPAKDGEQAGEAYWPNEGRIVVELRENLLEKLPSEHFDRNATSGRAIFEADGMRYILRVARGNKSLSRVLVHNTGAIDLDSTVVAVVDAVALEDDAQVIVAVDELEPGEHDLWGDDVRRASETIDALERWIALRPASLREYRDVLDQANALVLAKKCEGTERDSAIAAVKQAEKIWKESVEGVNWTGNYTAVARVREALGKVAEATLAVARSCASGQLEMFPSRLPDSLASALRNLREGAVTERSLRVARAVRDSLTPDVRQKGTRASTEDGDTGFCYVASEAIWHLLGGPDSAYVPHRIVHERRSHWYLMNPAGSVIDVTVGQFRRCPQHESGARRAFIHPTPSKRAQLVMTRARARLRRAQQGDV